MSKSFVTSSKEKGARLIALDIIRGFLMLAILIDHFSWSHSIFSVFTGGGQYFSSPTEGFFLISGLLVGYIYRDKILINAKKVIAKLWKRAAKLYVLSVVLTFIFTLWGRALPSSHLQLTLWSSTDTKGLILHTVSSLYAFGYTEFLARYAIFMALAPLALYLLAKKKWWIVSALSTFLWAYSRSQNVGMQLLVWQFVFFHGAMLGYYMPRIETWVKGLTLKSSHMLSRTIYSVALSTFLASAILLAILPLFGKNIIHLSPALTDFFDKDSLGPGRILTTIFWYPALFLFISKHSEWLSKGIGAVLEYIGKNSLLAYIVHGFLLFIAAIFFAPTPNIFQNTVIVSVLCVLLYYSMRLILRYHDLIRDVPYKELLNLFRFPRSYQVSED